jgi:hypothetical protein
VPDPAPVDTPQVAEKHAREHDEEVELQDTTPALESEPARHRPDDEQAPGKPETPKGHKVKSLSVASDEQAPATTELVVQSQSRHRPPRAGAPSS